MPQNACSEFFAYFNHKRAIKSYMNKCFGLFIQDILTLKECKELKMNKNTKMDFDL